MKERSGGEWRMSEALSDEWKGEIYPLLELYTDRTPGASSRRRTTPSSGTTGEPSLCSGGRSGRKTSKTTSCT
ncbi:hypothetical protein [Methanoculleus chikugoensis]|uniref:hypothetical protein n=1 Tax=Methanoculleus chikugoensis TaxID=118126 RepID=UPI001FB32828|nr:hypothetical protein [Methanoculleus chikugoensis]